jgi:creatinine amidohydrolase/Fe(II)-dependent formamide hydrolase-like protein
MGEAVDEDDYETFFEYRMDQYSKSGVVGRGATKATAELGEKLFAMVVDALVPMVKNALEEEEKISEYDNKDTNNKDKTDAVRK